MFQYFWDLQLEQNKQNLHYGSIPQKINTVSKITLNLNAEAMFQHITYTQYFPKLTKNKTQTKPIMSAAQREINLTT